MLVLVFLDLNFCGMVQRMSTYWDTLPSSGEAAGRQPGGWPGVGTALGPVAFLATFEAGPLQNEIFLCASGMKPCRLSLFYLLELCWPQQSCQGVGLEHKHRLLL